MGTIEEAWNIWVKSVCSQCDQQAIELARMAFYGGASVVVGCVVRGVNPKQMADLSEELKQETERLLTDG